MTAKEPKGEMTIRTQAMPADTNPAGDIFGGWLLSQMDIAGNIISKREAGGRTVTIAVDAMTFHLPVFVGDVVSCYTDIIKKGTSSITVRVEAWVLRQYTREHVKVTEGIFTFVAIDENRKPRPLKQNTQ